MQGYKNLLKTYYALSAEASAATAAAASSVQVTLLMVLPPKINLDPLDGLEKTETIGHELGVGYARLAIQLTAYTLRLDHVWLMDDNVQDCYELRYQALLQNGKHDPLQRISFGRVMTHIQDQVNLRCRLDL